MQVELTDKLIVDLYENLSSKIVKSLSESFEQKEKLIELKIYLARTEGYNILEAKELINEYENNKIGRASCRERV